ncbi:thiolase family protein [Mollicutes bacterium LVI A0039]|nr:thiolase family protein [Mollicutes bacterium LVI A0039]
MREVVIVAYGRSAIGRAGKGSFAMTRPEDLGGQVLKGVLAKVPNLPLDEIDDVVVGCSFPEAEQGMNIAKVIASEAGLPEVVGGQTVNRFCSSGLQTIATAANAIACDQGDIIIAGGVESMSQIPMGGNIVRPSSRQMIDNPKEWTTMGITAENVADKYGITRAEQDEFAVRSHELAAKARAEGKFKKEIIPVNAVKVVNKDGIMCKETFEVVDDECIRPGTTTESLAKLRPVFKMGGSVTAGTASQMSDGASFVVLMEKSKAESLGIKPICKFVSFAVTGLDPEYMGLGPIYAVNKLLARTNTAVEDIDLFEMNEAFASQAIASVRDLNLDMDKVNVNGGAIALGHPLGCSGSYLTCKLLNEMSANNMSKGIVTMCIGGGMGAAGLFEML